jgi:hypothetical protein
MSGGKEMIIERTIRRSQVVVPFGVGAIYDFGDESFVALDTSKWPSNYETLRLPRLEQALSSRGQPVEEFHMAPKKPSGIFPGQVRLDISLPFMRFPVWLFCQSCRNMYKWKWQDELPGKQPVCKQCNRKSRLVPMRFIAVCENGHIQDIDWIRWAHSKANTNKQKQCKLGQLQFVTKPSAGGGLKSLVVRCSACNASRDFGDLVKRDALQWVGLQCSGRQPWQHHSNATECDQVPQVVQRGASNAYYPVVVSAIDIRSETKGGSRDYSSIENHHYWSPLRDMYNATLNPSVTAKEFSFFLEKIANDTGFDVQEVWNFLTGGKGKEKTDKIIGDEELLAEEWRAFLKAEQVNPTAQFIAEPVDFSLIKKSLRSKGSYKEFRKLVSRVVLARKLRIVKALRGFQRLRPEITVPVDLGIGYRWLPGYEIFGEGIFVQIDGDRLGSWESRISPTYLQHMVAAKQESSLTFLPEISPRFVLLHTLSHLLIRQLCFECGYSASSLAERIYCSSGKDGMAGILIYTASADSEGGMGGLVRQGEADRFPGTFSLALHRGTWCSNDPICSELQRQGFQGLNKAACHACSLISETSCGFANCLLDRGLLYGNEHIQGFFSGLMACLED